MVMAAFCMSEAVTAAQNDQELDSLVTLPYNVSKDKNQITGTVYQIGEEELSKRVHGDLRGRLTGMIPGLEVKENGGSYFSAGSTDFGSYTLGSGAYTFTLNGFQGVVAIVDDMLVPYNELLLEPNQIESVTVLSNVLDKSKYGPLGSFGLLSFKTKRGGYNTPLRVNASVESGVRMIDRLPEYLSGEEYAAYNNVARQASGYDQLYSEDDLAAFAERNPNSMINPNVDYKSLLLKNIHNSTNLSVNLSAGNNIVKYAFSLNGLHSGDILKGPNDYCYDRITYSGSVTSRIGRYVEAGASFMGLFGAVRSDATSWHSYRSVPGVAFPMILSTEMGEDGKEMNVYGVSKIYEDNPYAARYESGRNTRKTRSGLFQAHLDLDFSWLLPGLKSRTAVQTNSFVFSNIGMEHDYLAYYWDKENGKTEISGHDGTKSTKRSMSSSTVSENLSMYERLSYNKTFGKHYVDAGAMFYLNRAFNQSDSDFERYMFFVWNADWAYDGRYAVELSAQYSGTDTFAKGSRFGFFPAMGLSWTVSNEDFLKDVEWIDNLKVRTQFGELPDRTDATSAHYLYETVYSKSGSYTYGPTTAGAATNWFGSNSRPSVNTTLSRYGNPNLTWGRLSEVNAGVDFGLFGCLDFSVNYFNWVLRNQVADVTSAMPDLFGIASMSSYANFTAKQTSGLNASVRFDKKLGDLRLTAGASATHFVSEHTKLVNDLHPEGHDHLTVTGTSVSAIWGYDCIGTYSSDSEIQSLPSLVDKALLKVGDLIYRDVNGDGAINSNDRIIIGDDNPGLMYALNIGLQYKGFDFEIVGTGRANVDLECTSDFFWNGWGDGNYSAFIKDPKYPNLSYVKSTNNFVESNYWLTDGGWFKIQALNIGYTLPLKKVGKSLRFDVKGENLLTFTNVKYIDPEAPAAGVTARPLMRVFTAGLTFKF